MEKILKMRYLILTALVLSSQAYSDAPYSHGIGTLNTMAQASCIEMVGKNGEFDNILATTKSGWYSSDDIENELTVFAAKKNVIQDYKCMYNTESKKIITLKKAYTNIFLVKDGKLIPQGENNHWATIKVKMEKSVAVLPSNATKSQKMRTLRVVINEYNTTKKTDFNEMELVRKYMSEESSH